jgi:poly-gamma-glutamate capsule biosynthesis protein CapA/YwtB (metallophosphatase superfamily)
LRTAAVIAVVIAAAAIATALALGFGGSSDGGQGHTTAVRTHHSTPPAVPAKRAQRPEQTKFTVSADGDLLMHSPLLDRALSNGGGDHYDFTPFFRKIQPYIAGVDLGICHLETPMGPGPPSSYPTFNTPTDLAKSIARSGWDACDTASNHTVDQGTAGVVGTIKALHHAGVEHTGSYRSERASERPTILSVHGIRLGFVAYTDATNGIPPPHPYSVNTYDYNDPKAGAKEILADVRRAHRAGADGVIVQLHWGFENAGHPNASQLAVAKRITRSKLVTVVVGQGPHVVQPIERIHHKFVVFSEGNLVSNQSASAGLPVETEDGLIALLRFAARGHHVHVQNVDYVPTWVRLGDYVVLPAFASEDPGHASDLRASYARTVHAAGTGKRFGPIAAP